MPAERKNGLSETKRKNSGTFAVVFGVFGLLVGIAGVFGGGFQYVFGDQNPSTKFARHAEKAWHDEAGNVIKNYGLSISEIKDLATSNEKRTTILEHDQTRLFGVVESIQSKQQKGLEEQRQGFADLKKAILESK